jgi:hypothetical protein
MENISWTDCVEMEKYYVVSRRKGKLAYNKKKER